jgi:diadenosine tetraphosphate (Ap4A) HIT family hydrolase
VSHDLHEPAHVHVDREDLSAKFWLEPVALAHNLGYPARELRKLEAITAEHQQQFLEAWNEYFRTTGG